MRAGSDLWKVMRRGWMFMFAILLLWGCAPRPSLAGKWMDSQGGVLELGKDGTAAFTLGNLSSRGVYRVQDRGRIAMDLQYPWSQTGLRSYGYEIKDSKLVLTGDSGAVFEMTRFGDAEASFYRNTLKRNCIANRDTLQKALRMYSMAKGSYPSGQSELTVEGYLGRELRCPVAPEKDAPYSWDESGNVRCSVCGE
ncbi:MAG: hypothetical protein ACM3WV_02655 [Bacillota bacterium]